MGLTLVGGGEVDFVRQRSSFPGTFWLRLWWISMSPFAVCVRLEMLLLSIFEDFLEGKQAVDLHMT